MVLCEDRLRPIETVREGDLVLTHKGRWRRVLRTGMRESPIGNLRGQGHWGFRCSPDMPILVDDGTFVPAYKMGGERWANAGAVPQTEIPDFDRGKRGYILRGGRYRVTGWKDGRTVYLGTVGTASEAEAIRKAALASGRISVRGADGADVRTAEFAYFLGRWVGDGWTSGDSVFICDSHDKKDEVVATFRNAGMSASSSDEEPVFKARCGSKGLVSWLRRNFGSGAKGKTLPSWLFGQSMEYRAAFLRGWMESDGHCDRGVWCVNTASRGLAVGLKILLVGLGLAPSLRWTGPRNPDGTVAIEGRMVHESGYWGISWSDHPRSFRFGEDGKGFGLVRSLDAAAPETGHFLDVEEDGSFVADGVVVHGNAIVPQVTAVFIEAYMDWDRECRRSG